MGADGLSHAAGRLRGQPVFGESDLLVRLHARLLAFGPAKIDAPVPAPGSRISPLQSRLRLARAASAASIGRGDSGAEPDVPGRLGGLAPVRTTLTAVRPANFKRSS
jgi:hypothetical protein